MQPAGALMVALSVAHAASLRTPLLTALRCCKLALSWLRCYVASWRSCAGVMALLISQLALMFVVYGAAGVAGVNGAADAASLRSHGCVVGGAIMQPACALMMA